MQIGADYFRLVQMPFPSEWGPVTLFLVES